MGGSGGGPAADGDASDPGRPLGDGDFVIPDDASALDADRLAWLTEERARRRRERLDQLGFARRNDRFMVSGPIVVICLAAVALVGTLLPVVIPRSAHPQPGPRALADVPSIQVPVSRVEASVSAAPSMEISTGPMVGRRLPDDALRTDTGRVSTTTLRPAVILLVPPSCGCTSTVSALYRQAQEFRLPLWLVSAGSSAEGRAQLVRLDDEGAGGGARWAEDIGSVLHRALLARGATVVLIASDGVVASVVRNIPAAGRGIPALELVLALLASPPE
jgi:hypothetical protein